MNMQSKFILLYLFLRTLHWTLYADLTGKPEILHFTPSKFLAFDILAALCAHRDGGTQFPRFPLLTERQFQ